jgi:Protein of unknown function (DUF1194)
MKRLTGKRLSQAACGSTLLAVAVWSLALMAAGASGAGARYDLALVLAVDCSGSVDGQEYRLQIDGIAAAFRDPEVIAASRAGPHGRIAVNLVTWGDPDFQKYSTGWFDIDSTASAETFAHVAEQFEGRVGGGTGLGVAIAYGVTLLQTGGREASRRVIDVSGDGIESWELRELHFRLPDAHRLRAAAHVTVNGLAIRTDFPDLDRYYRANVAAGPDSFVMAVETYRDFQEAVRIKLLREIRPLSASLAP